MSTSESNTRMMSGVRELVGAEVLLVDQDERVVKGVTQLLSAATLHVTAATTPEEALAHLDRRFFSVVVIDLDTPTPGAGIATTRAVKEKSPTSMVVMLTPRKSFEDTVRAIRAGAIDIILKAPDSVQYLKERVMEAAGRSAGRRQVDSVLGEVRDAHEEFLRRFMEAERRALDLSDRLAGRDPTEAAAEEQIRVLLVDAGEGLARALTEKAPPGFVFSHGVSGGQGLDLCSASRFHIAMVSESLDDLPGSMVVRSIKTQNPEMVAILYSGPGPGAKVEIVESSRTITVVDDFTDVGQFIGRLDELAEAFRAKTRERRYTQAFRERHYDFLRRYVELKIKIERAVSG
jgi:DNA-binding response OmpR family regulator